MLSRHRNAEKTLPVPLVKIFWKPAALIAENQGITGLKLQLVKRTLPFRGKKEKATRPADREIILPRVMHLEIKMPPIIKTGAGDRLVVEPEAQRTDEIDRHSKPNRQPAYRTGIVRDFRPQQNYRKTTAQTDATPMR